MSTLRQNTTSARKVYLPRQPLTSEEVFEYTQAFILFDRDEDDYINAKDLSILIRSLEQNPTDDQIQQLIENIVDEECNLIDCKQFLIMMSVLKKTRDSDNKRELREIFDAIDGDGNGSIESEELRALMTLLTNGNDEMKLTKEEADAMIAEIDVDKDKRIGFDEFLTMFEGQT
ncbi:unnamed protein product [Adineta ricciae]|uniref:EF-hand domain-containing protein n=2 Tax=Adineta ricciae TaxID=249248 RepID=A0A814MB94_ADIRI|nr:unnamed protein product [Adineta ricciae]